MRPPWSSATTRGFPRHGANRSGEVSPRMHGGHSAATEWQCGLSTPTVLVPGLSRVRSVSSAKPRDPIRALESCPRRVARCPSRCSSARCLSARHGVDVCRALGDGVLKALQELLTARPMHGAATARSAVRTLAHSALPDPVSPVRGGAWARPGLASVVSRSLQPRLPRHVAADGPAAAWIVEGPAGNFPGGPRRLLRR